MSATATPMQIGAILKVTDPEDLFYEAECLLVDIREGTLYVYFPCESTNLISDFGDMALSEWDTLMKEFNEKEDEGILQAIKTLQTPDLCPRVFDYTIEQATAIPRWSPGTMANRLFGYNSYHHLGHNGDIREGEICQKAECRKPATKYTMVNVWGTALELHFCEDCHKQNHGFCMDDISLKRR